MELCHKHSVSLLTVVLFLCMSSLSIALADAAVRKQRPFNNTLPSFLVFGDSTVDPGNNNFVPTFFRGNFPPYGMDFKDQTPTGRFSNGRLSTDFIASYVGIKDFVPPYLDPTLSVEELSTGVSFASAASGFDPLTPKLSGVVGMPKQLDYFREYKKRLGSVLGKKNVEDKIRRTVFFVSAGTNDFVINYFALPIRQKTYTSVSGYQRFIIQNVKDFLQGLLQEGARKIAIAGLPPMGCLPAVITLNSEIALPERGCIERYSSAAREYNHMLQNEVNLMNRNLANRGAKIFYVDVYSPLLDMIQGPGKSQFDEVSYGCCGTGFIEAGFLCNPKSYVCPDASRYVFFDAIHPTEKTYQNMFEASRPTVDTIIRD